MSTKLQIEKLTRISDLTAILCHKISRKLATVIRTAKNMTVKNMTVKNMTVKNMTVKNMTADSVEKETFKISLQSSKQMMRRKDASLSSVIAVRKRNIMSMSASLLHQ